MTPHPPNDRFEEMNRDLLRLRLRRGFGEFLLTPDVQDDERRLAGSLDEALRDLRDDGRWRRRGMPSLDATTLDGFATDVGDRLMLRWRQGDLYALAPEYLIDQLRGQLTAHYRARNAAGRRSQQAEDAAAPEEPEDGVEVPDGYRSTLEGWRDELRGRLAGEAHLLAVFDRWVESGGRHGWIQDTANALADATGAAGEELDEERRRRYRWVYNRAIPRLRERVRLAFDPLFEGANTEEQVIERVHRVIDYLHGLRDPAAMPLTEASTQDDPDLARFRWLRQQQGERMRQRACSPTHESLLELYALGCTEGEILEQVYGGGPPARRRLDADLDRLHGWYREITLDALETIRAWRFYDAIQPRHGVGEVRCRLSQSPDAAAFAPVLEAARMKVPFLDLLASDPQARGRLLEMRRLWNESVRRRRQPSGCGQGG